MESLTAADPRTVGEFRLRARLGAGGMGRVFLATSLGGRMVAVKVIHEELATDTEFVRRFRAEVDAARRVSGMYTAPVVAAGVDDIPPWLATAFVPGPALDKVVANHGPLPLAAVWRLGAGLAEALRAIHSSGLVHRDLKPANVLMASDGPRVIDFGISRAASDAGTRLTTTGSIIGTPSYMSPEQVEGNHTGPASDVFSLGSVLAFAASGVSPFTTGTNASSAAVLYRVVHAEPDLAKVPGEVRGLIEACLSKDQALRPDLGQVAGICGTAAEQLRLTHATFWPPDVARVISEQSAAVAAQIDRLQDGVHGAPVDGGPYGSPLPGGGGMVTTPSRLEPPMPTQPPFWPPAGPPAPAGQAGTPAPVGYQGHPGYAGTPGYQGAPGYQGVPGYPPAYRPFRPERGASRRGLIIGLAAFAGVAAVGGTIAAVVSSETSATPGPFTPALVPAPSGVALYHGEGTAKSPEWKFTAGDRFQASPGTGDGAVYFVTEDGTLYAIDIATRRKLWTQSTDNVYAAPRVVGNLVLASTSSGKVYTFDAATGKPAWTLSSGIGGSIYQQNLAVSGGKVIVPSLESPPTAYDARTGAPANITYSVPDNYVPAITAAGGVVYAMVYGGTMYAFRAATGARLWSSDVYSSGKVVTGLVADGGNVYLGTESDPGTLYAIDAASGNVRWKYQPGGIVFTAPVPANGMVYVKTATNGAVHALDAQTGKLAWKHVTSVSGSNGLAVAGGRIYYSLSLAVQALDAKTGTPVWKFDPGNYDSMSTTPAVASGLVFIGSSAGTLYAIKE